MPSGGSLYPAGDQTRWPRAPSGGGAALQVCKTWSEGVKGRVRVVRFVPGGIGGSGGTPANVKTSACGRYTRACACACWFENASNPAAAAAVEPEARAVAAARVQVVGSQMSRSSNAPSRSRDWRRTRRGTAGRQVASRRPDLSRKRLSRLKGSSLRSQACHDKPEAGRRQRASCGRPRFVTTHR